MKTRLSGAAFQAATSAVEPTCPAPAPKHAGLKAHGYILIQMLRILVLILANSVASFAVTLVGAVRDSSGALIPAVTVELTAQAPGPPLIIRTDTSGQFRAANLSAGPYQIKIVHAGFQPYTQTVEVEANQTNAVEIRLEVAKIVRDAAFVEFVESHFNQNASTESFKRVVDKQYDAWDGCRG